MNPTDYSNLFPPSKASINRAKYAAAEAARADLAERAKKERRARAVRERRPVAGSAEWCETYADDRGESPDY